jgi:glycosyltransferase involved in cell wall biosynthesis
MKILQVVGSLDRGGVETWLAQMLAHLDRRKYAMDFLVHTATPGALDKQVRGHGARILPCLPKLQDGHPFRYARSFRSILRECGPYDCVHSHIHHSSGYILMLAAMGGVPVRIAHSHNDTCALDRRSGWARRAYCSAMNGLIRRYATLGMAVSRAAAPALFSEAWTSDRRWRLCPLGIDLKLFTPPVDARGLRRELGIAPDAFVVGHVGRFAEQKNHRFLVEIARHFRLLEPAAVFLLVGDGPSKAEIEALVRQHGMESAFAFAGVRADVEQLMTGAMDCFLFPSCYEGLGLVLWEAQAAGLPCLVSDVVPAEASVAPGLVRRLPLAADAAVWAAELARIRLPAGRPRDPMSPRLAACSIEASAVWLSQIYDSADSDRNR